MRGLCPIDFWFALELLRFRSFDECAYLLLTNEQIFALIQSACICPRHQGVDVSDEVTVGEAGEEIAQIGIGLDAVHLASADESGEPGPISATFIVTRKKRIDGSWSGCGWQFRPGWNLMSTWPSSRNSRKPSKLVDR